MPWWQWETPMMEPRNSSFDGFLIWWNLWEMVKGGWGTCLEEVAHNMGAPLEGYLALVPSVPPFFTSWLFLSGYMTWSNSQTCLSSCALGPLLDTWKWILILGFASGRTFVNLQLECITDLALAPSLPHFFLKLSMSVVLLYVCGTSDHMCACVHMCVTEGVHVEVREQLWYQSSPSALCRTAASLLLLTGACARTGAYMLLESLLPLPPTCAQSTGILDRCATLSSFMRVLWSALTFLGLDANSMPPEAASQPWPFLSCDHNSRGLSGKMVCDKKETEHLG